MEMMSSACCMCMLGSIGFLVYDSTKTKTVTPIKTWPEVVGMDIDAAVAYIESQPGRLYVEKYPDTTQAFTMDSNLRRVRVIYNPQTRRVTRVPQYG
jgi:hypothetical protein